MSLLLRRRKFVSLGLTLFALSVTHPCPVAVAANFSDMNLSLTDGFVIPGYQALAADLSALSVNTRHYCVAPHADKLKLLKHAYVKAMITWQHIRIIRVGPIMRNARDARVQFWPDKRGTAARQIRRALGNKDLKLLSPDGLTGKSVALQSLSAFEYLMSTSPSKPFSCGLMLAISEFQATLARDVLREWQQSGGFRDTILSAGKDNPIFVNNAAPAAAFLKSIAAMLDIVIRQKLEAPLGKDINHALPRSAESWRTEQSRRNISANLDALARMFEIPGGFSTALSNRKSKALADSIVRELRTVSQKISKLAMPLSQAVVNAETRPAVEQIIGDLKDIRILIRESVVNTLGLPIGFNSLDGD
jgi:predicted lipoprotein